MRLLIIGLVAFVIAGCAMLVTDGRLMRHWGVAQLWEGDIRRHRFDLTRWTPAPRGTSIVIPVRHGDWLAMSGFPSYATLHFPLPRSAQPTAGRVVLALTLQLPENGGGSIRVSINGERRGEALFESDFQRYRLSFDLTASDLRRREVVVSLAADGYNAVGECPDERSRAFVLIIEPRSRLELELARPIDSVDDAIALAGAPLRLGWPDDAARRVREETLLLALKLAQRHVPIEFSDTQNRTRSIMLRVDPSRSEEHFDAARQSAFVRGARAARRIADASGVPHHQHIGGEPGQWTAPLAGFGAIEWSRQFRREIKWRAQFPLHDMPAGEAPTALRLALQFSPPSSSDDWIVSVTLNDTLIFADRLTAHDTRLNREISLRTELIALDNTLEITLVNGEDRVGICNPGKEAFAQLLRATALAGGTHSAEHEPVSLPAHLFSSGAVRIAAPEPLTREAASEAVELLNRVVHHDADLQTAATAAPRDAAIITILPFEHFAARARERLDASAHDDVATITWIGVLDGAHIDRAGAESFMLLSEASANQIQRFSHARTVVLIQHPARRSDGENT